MSKTVTTSRLAVSRSSRLAAAALVLLTATTARAGFEIRGTNIPHPPPLSGGATQSDSTIAPTGSVGIGMTADATGGPAPVTAVPIGAPAPVDQAPAAAARADSGYVDGFGNDLPLVMALQQIAPPGYQFSFAPGVDAGQHVSWQGGKSWRDVLTEMLGTRGLTYDVQNNQIISVMPESDAAQMPVQTAQVTPPKSKGNEQSIRREKPSSVLGRMRAQLTGDSGEPAWRHKGSTSNDADWNDDAQDDGASMPPAAPVPPAAAAPAAEDLSPIALTAAPSQPVAPMAPASVPAVSDPVFAGQGAAGAYAPVAAQWQAQAGQTLRQTLTNWAAQAGVTLFWSIDYDYRLPSNVRLNGSFADAAAQLLDSFSAAQPRPYAQLHQPPGQPQTLVVKAYGVGN